MSTPDLEDVLKCAAKTVFQARKEGNLGSLTARLIRQKLEEDLALKAGTLDAPEYKKPLKDAIAAAIQKPREELEEEPEPEKKEVKKTAKRKRKVAAEGEEEGGVKPKVKTQKKDATKPPQSRGRPTPRSKSAKSAEVVEDSDGDEDVKPAPVSKPAEEKVASEDELPKPSSSKPRSPPKPKSTSSRPSNKKFTSADTIDTDDEGEDAPAKPSKSQPKSASKVLSDGDAEAKSDTEMSDVIDEAPKKSKGRRKTSEKPAPKMKRGQKSSQALSKDEATVKRLKSFVAACGARKVWSKEFKGLDSSSQQISRLRAILAELGMTGRLSMEAARAIKEKREIEQELKDVQAFEKAVVSGRPFRTRDAGKARPKDEAEQDEQDDGDEDDEVVELPAKRKATRNARQSIMAFLGDQNDSE